MFIHDMVYSYLRDIGIKKICKVLKHDVGAETLEQILNVLLDGATSAAASKSSEPSEEEPIESIDLVKWLTEIITFDRFSLTVRLLDAALLARVLAWVDSLGILEDENLQHIRDAFSQ
mmetsp:Transcript_11154/g.20668  ORF Transcript_11154/g.20668 Transcript_11154/m.20668 type:complete len:118 (+) Transcript_11154:550-903(+)